MVSLLGIYFFQPIRERLHFRFGFTTLFLTIYQQTGIINIRPANIPAIFNCNKLDQLFIPAIFFYYFMGLLNVKCRLRNAFSEVSANYTSGGSFLYSHGFNLGTKVNRVWSVIEMEFFLLTAVLFLLTHPCQRIPTGRLM